MSDCKHSEQKLVDGKWLCHECGEEPPKKRSGIEECVSAGRATLADVEPAGYFSFSLGKYVSNRREHHEGYAALNDPNRNVEHIHRPMPKERQKYIDQCLDKGIVP